MKENSNRAFIKRTSTGITVFFLLVFFTGSAQVKDLFSPLLANSIHLTAVSSCCNKAFEKKTQ